MSELSFRCVSFAELDTDELYALLQLRSAVFIFEQNCVYQDMDGYDRQALHVLGERDGALQCYARLLPPGIKFPHGSSIGRVLSSEAVRGSGHGRQLMSYCVARCEDNWPQAPIMISAQEYLEGFYSSFGFETVRGPYMEDGIPHLEMHRRP